MVEIGKSKNFTQEQLEDLFLLGFIHDIGYRFGDNKNHNIIGGEILKRNNYKNYEEVLNHGLANTQYKSEYLDILNTADMMIDSEGNDVSFEERLEDIETRYGKDSVQYQGSLKIIGKLGGTMELLDIYDENNNFLGYSADRGEVHDKNLWHYHVSAWIMNEKGEILLQQRSLTKKKNPGNWAKTGGHVDAGESCEESIKREVYEEIGLVVNDDEVKNIEIYKSKNPNEHYFAYNYIFFTDLKEEDFVLQKEEVERVKYYTIEELEEIRKRNDSSYNICHWDEEDFNRQMSLLKKYREYHLEKINHLLK